MHELSLTEKILKIVLETATANQASKVTAVKIVIGELSGIMPEAVATYFELIAKDTIAADAKLEFTSVKATLYCSACNREFTKPDSDFSCPDCGNLGRLGASGHECAVTSSEVE